MSKILIVEDSRFFTNVLKRELAQQFRLEILTASTFGEGIALAKENAADISIALLDINLPDAPDGEIVAQVRKLDIPVIVFSGSCSLDRNQSLFNMGVLDCVPKDSIASLFYLTNIVKRTLANKQVKALVVDDSATQRKHIADTLRLFQMQVFEADGGNAALHLLVDNPDIRLVITDYHMPDMDGYELVKTIRKFKDRTDLIIIGMTAGDDACVSPKFLKAGANDFLHKPFQREEFFCRVTQNLDFSDQLRHSREMAMRDPLTGLYNRRFLYESSTNVMASARRGQVTVTVAMLDIDHFKKINDTFGHEIGDKAILSMSDILKAEVRDTDVVARYGGEEFCIMAVDMAPEHTESYFENLRSKIGNVRIGNDDEEINMTVSIGVCDRLLSNLDEMLREADHNLYNAKSSGRNQVVIST